VLSLGAIQGEVHGGTPLRHSTFHALFGPRVGLSLRLGRALSFVGHVEGAYALTTTTLRASGAELWTTPSFSGLIALGISGRRP
jgi:hypothetical protein